MSRTGRPSEYKEEYIKKVDEYLKQRNDNSVKVVKQSNLDKGIEIYEYHDKVQLPTLEGFARYIDVNKTSLYEWEKIHPEFSNALEKIRIEQKERLLNKGLSGEYNSTIAKLILSANHGMNEKQEVDHTTKGEKIESTPLIVDLTSKLNEIYRGTSGTSNGGDASSLDTKTQD